MSIVMAAQACCSARGMCSLSSSLQSDLWTAREVLIASRKLSS